MTVTYHQVAIHAAAIIHPPRGASGVSPDLINVEADVFEQWLYDHWRDDDQSRAALLGAVDSVGAGANAASVCERADEVLRLIGGRTISSIRVGQETATIAVGETLQLVAEGNFWHGGWRPITDRAYWQSSDETVATVSSRTQDGPAHDAPGGLVTALTAGETTISVSHEDYESSSYHNCVVTVTEEPPPP